MKAETKLRVAACAAGFALPRYNDLPSVGLYLDQTVQFVNGYFRSFCGVELTPSMVSNYVKKGWWITPSAKIHPGSDRIPDVHCSLQNSALDRKYRHPVQNAAGALLRRDSLRYLLRGTGDQSFRGVRQQSRPAGDCAQRRASAAAQHHFAAVNKMYLDCCFDALRQEQALWSDILPDLA